MLDHYRVDCSICHKIYIGQTSRTIRRRIIEHNNDPTSHIFQHMQSHATYSPVPHYEYYAALRLELRSFWCEHE
jgi:predicted GIY-YIG superfamily endonuclease